MTNSRGTTVMVSVTVTVTSNDGMEAKGRRRQKRELGNATMLHDPLLCRGTSLALTLVVGVKSVAVS